MSTTTKSFCLRGCRTYHRKKLSMKRKVAVIMKKHYYSETKKKEKNYGSWSCLLWHIFLSRLYKNIKNIILLYRLVTKAWFIGPDHNSRLIRSTLGYDQGSCIIIVRKLFCIPPKKINSYTINDMGRPYVKYFHSTICWFHLINPAQ